MKFLEVLQTLHKKGHTIIFDTRRAFENNHKLEEIQKFETPVHLY